MLRVGLSGGIGSGKSTVSARLAELGAVVIDADAVAREVVAPGTAGLVEIVDRFGSDILGPDGALDRPALGTVVFDDPVARRDLEQITHPRIRARSAALMKAAPEDAVVVHDIPLLVEMGLLADYALTLIVDVPEAERERRLVELRGMDPGAARARIAAQAGDEQRAAAADVLLDNNGSRVDLRERVDRLWHERLSPFERNLREGRVPDVAAPARFDPPSSRLTDRVLSRLRAALGEAVVGADLDRPDVPAQAGGAVAELQIMLADPTLLDHPASREALRLRGFLVLGGSGPGQTRQPEPDERHGGDVPGGGMIVSADPAQAVRCHVRS